MPDGDAENRRGPGSQQVADLVCASVLVLVQPLLATAIGTVRRMERDLVVAGSPKIMIRPDFRDCKATTCTQKTQRTVQVKQLGKHIEKNM